jgi:DNA helicase-2/ATP-dependent DNA helicase PcrA
MVSFSDNQKDYINSSLEENIYLRACPGAGKTEVIAAKVALEIRRWARFPTGMAVLSFSRSATAELSDRISKVRRGNTSVYPHFVGTVDSFILNQVVTPLAHLVTGYVGRDGDYSLKVVGPEALSFYRVKYPIEKQPIAANRYDWDAAEGRYLFWHASDAVRRKLNALVLKDWQIRDLNDAKRRFNAGGFVTYKDVERLAIEILTTPRFRERLGLLVERFPTIIIDECQDLSAEQITIFTHLANLGVRFHLVGDLDQAIYGFRNCFPEAVADFIGHLGCTEMPLIENFRSGQLIVELHGRLVNAGKTQGKANYAPVTCYLVEYAQCPTEVLGQFDALAVGHGQAVIVARGHSTLAKLRALDAEPGPVQLLAAAIAAFVSDTPGSLHAALSIFAHYLSENCMECDTLGVDLFFRPVGILSAESWHLFLSDCLSGLSRQGLGEQDITWKLWCKILREALPSLASVACNEAESQRILATMRAKKHPAPAGLGEEKVRAAAQNLPVHERKRTLATIHEVKGETHDLTMLVSSSKQGEDSHWKEWLADPQSEAARFAYVASSRPRHILIWAVKALKAPDRKKLVDLGFQAHP